MCRRCTRARLCTMTSRCRMSWWSCRAGRQASERRPRASCWLTSAPRAATPAPRSPSQPGVRAACCLLPNACCSGASVPLKRASCCKPRAPLCLSSCLLLAWRGWQAHVRHAPGPCSRMRGALRSLRPRPQLLRCAAGTEARSPASRPRCSRWTCSRRGRSALGRPQTCGPWGVCCTSCSPGRPCSIPLTGRATLRASQRPAWCVPALLARPCCQPGQCQLQAAPC